MSDQTDHLHHNWLCDLEHIIDPFVLQIIISKMDLGESASIQR